MTAEGSVTNPGSIYSEQIIKRFGSGDTNLTINSEFIKLKELQKLKAAVVNVTIMAFNKRVIYGFIVEYLKSIKL